MGEEASRCIWLVERGMCWGGRSLLSKGVDPRTKDVTRTVCLAVGGYW